MPATAGRINAIMKDGRTARRLLSDERSAEKARDRSARLRSVKETKDEREYSRQKRQILRELGLQPGGSAWGRIFHVKVEKAPSRQKRKGEKSLNPTKLRLGIRKYKAALRDGRGRVAVFVRMRYLGQKSKGYRSGLAADHVKYIFREDGLEDPEIQMAAPMSNIGYTVQECTAFWHALEPIEEGYRANSKVQFRLTVALPYFFNAEQRRRVTQAIGDQVFGRYGLGWMGANHIPDAKGSQRNFHPHFAASMRPAERIGDHEWAFTEEKLTERFTPEGLLRMRAEIAAIINIECRRAGFEERYTHQSYQRRGIDAVTTEHVGPERMALHDKGEPVGAVERNNARVEANEYSVEAQYLSKKVAIQERLVELAKESVARARRSVGVQMLKGSVTHVRDTAVRWAAMESSAAARHVLSDAGEQLRIIRDSAEKMRSAKGLTVSATRRRVTLNSVMTKARNAAQADADKPQQIDQTAREAISGLTKKPRRDRGVQLRLTSAPSREAVKLVARQAGELRQFQQGDPAQVVQRAIIPKIQSILQSAGSLCSSEREAFSLRIATMGQLDLIRKRATVVLKARQPKAIDSSVNRQFGKVIESAKGIARQASVRHIARQASVSLAGLARAAYGLPSVTPPRKLDQNSITTLVAITRQARDIRTSPKLSSRSYTEELELLRNIRAAVVGRTVSAPARSASDGPQTGQLGRAVARNTLKVASTPAPAQANRPITMVPASSQMKDGSSVGRTAEGSAPREGVSNKADPVGFEQKANQSNDADLAKVKARMNGDNAPPVSGKRGRTEQAGMPLIDHAAALGDTRTTSRLSDEPQDWDPQSIVELLSGKRFAVEEAHRGMVVPLTPVFAKHGLSDGAMLQPVVQAAMAERLERQREDERLMVPVLARYVREQDMAKDDKIIARLPDDEQRRRVEEWRGTGLLHLLMTRIRDDQKRETKKLYRKWHAARSENLPERASLAAMANSQQQRWPIELPQDDRKAIEHDAAIHRQRQAQMQARAQGIGY